MQKLTGRKSNGTRYNTALSPPSGKKADHENAANQRATHQTKSRIMQTLSADRSIRTTPRQTPRFRGSQGKQTGLGSTGDAAYGFLSHHFLPLCEPRAVLPEAANVEGGFFQ